MTWALFTVYLVTTGIIAWRGGRTISGSRGFALVLLMGQVGVYGLVAASAGPIVLALVPRRAALGAIGLERRALSARWAGTSALGALGIHLTLYLSGWTTNPGVSALAGMLTGVGLALGTSLTLSRTQCLEAARAT